MDWLPGLPPMVVIARWQDTPQQQGELDETRTIRKDCQTLLWQGKNKTMTCTNHSPQRETPDKFLLEVQWVASPTSEKSKDYEDPPIYVWLPAPFITILAYKTLGFYRGKKQGRALSIFI